MLKIREIDKGELKGLLELYTQLHNNPLPIIDGKVERLWDEISGDKNHHIIVGCIDEKIVSSCVLIIVPNLTHYQRPYALVENVITAEEHRGKGYATRILNHAKELAIKQNCYKIMLLTSSKEESTLKLYRKAGYNSEDKTGFVQWLR